MLEFLRHLYIVRQIFLQIEVRLTALHKEGQHVARNEDFCEPLLSDKGMFLPVGE